jgi:hypothetical protein
LFSRARQVFVTTPKMLAAVRQENKMATPKSLFEFAKSEGANRKSFALNTEPSDHFRALQSQRFAVKG